MRYFALTSKSLRRRTPKHHPPFVRDISKKNNLKKYLKIRKIYAKPGFNYKRYVYRLPKYKRIQRFFQRNRVYMRKLYGQMRDNHIAALTKKINQKVDKRRRLSKNIGQYLEFQASAFLLINRFYPKVNELRQLVQNNKISVNGKSFKGFYKKMHSYDFCKFNDHNRPNNEPFINHKLRKSAIKRIKKLRVVSSGYANATIQMNSIKDPYVSSNFFFNYKQKFEVKDPELFFNNLNCSFRNWFMLNFWNNLTKKSLYFKLPINRLDFNPKKKINWMQDTK